METTITQYGQMHITYLTHGMNSTAIIIITMEVHYTACEGMDYFFKFKVVLIS